MCLPYQDWHPRYKCCGRGATAKVACAECAKMCTVGEGIWGSKGFN